MNSEQRFEEASSYFSSPVYDPDLQIGMCLHRMQFISNVARAATWAELPLVMHLGNT